MQNSAPVKREFHVANTGPKDVEVEWKLYNMVGNEKRNEYFNLKIVEPMLGSTDIVKLDWQAIEPP